MAGVPRCGSRNQGQRSRAANASSSQVAAVHGEGLPSGQVPAVEP